MSYLDKEIRIDCPIDYYFKWQGKLGQMYRTVAVEGQRDKQFVELKPNNYMLILDQSRTIGGKKDEKYLSSNIFKNSTDKIVVKYDNRIVAQGPADHPDVKSAYKAAGGKFYIEIYFLITEPPIDANDDGYRLCKLSLKGLALVMWFEFLKKVNTDYKPIVHFLSPILKKGDMGDPSLVPVFKSIDSEPKAETHQVMMKYGKALKAWLDNRYASQETLLEEYQARTSPIPQQGHVMPVHPSAAYQPNGYHGYQQPAPPPPNGQYGGYGGYQQPAAQPAHAHTTEMYEQVNRAVTNTPAAPNPPPAANSQQRGWTPPPANEIFGNPPANDTSDSDSDDLPF